MFLFSCYLPPGITPPIFNMGSIFTGSANRPAINLAYHEPPGQFHGIQIVHLEQLK